MKSSTIKLLAIGLFFLPLILILQNPSWFPYPSLDAEYSDVAISHYPNSLYLKRELLETCSIPLWSRAILSGYPFAANPLSGLWYPPGWLAIIFPLPLGFNLVAALHLLWGGYGLYRYLKLEGLSDRSAIFGALVFEFMPKLIAHYGAGHLTLFYAVNWTPWLLWSARKTKNISAFSQLIPACILALICLADPRWVIYSGILWMIQGVAHRSSLNNKKKAFMNVSIANRFLDFLKSFVMNMINKLPQIVIAILLACPLLIPLIEYTRLSTRVSMSAEEILVFSLPPGRLLGLVFPNFGGNHELIVYAGGTVIILVVVSVLKKDKQHNVHFWLWLSLLSIVFSLGSNIPLVSDFFRLSGLNLLRVPTRMMFLSFLSFAMIAAYTIEDFLTYKIYADSRRVLLGMITFAAFVVFLFIGMWFVLEEIPLNFLYGVLLVLFTCLWIGARIVGRIPGNLWFVGLILIALFDWFMVDRSLLSFKNNLDVLNEKNEVATYLSEQEGYFRVYSPSYSLPQQVAMEYDLDLADGVDPLQLEIYANYMEKSTGVPRLGYQVTIPTFENGDPDRDNITHIPDPFLLGQLNVRFIVSEFDLIVDELALRKEFGDTRIYENTKSYPRAWMKVEGTNPDDEVQEVEIKDWYPNQIAVSASGPGLLVLSEIMYPGWKVIVDGEEKQLEAFNGIFRSVKLSEGRHKVLFKFQPASIWIGLGFFITGIIIAIIYSRLYRGRIY